jgi:beta-phosphoglucomutase family hydrolase
MIKALIFDMDGVVVHNDRYHYEAWYKYALKLGKEVSFDEVKSWFGNNNAAILRNLTGKDLTSSEIEIHSHEKEKLYRKLYKKDIKAVEGLQEFIEHAKRQGLKIGLATSAPPANVEFILEGTGLMDFFDAITDDTQIQHGKPDPEIFLKTADKLKVNPGDALVFEDSFHGIEAARRAGMKVVGVATTHEKKALKKSNLQINDFKGLTIEELNKLWDQE